MKETAHLQKSNKEIICASLCDSVLFLTMEHRSHRHLWLRVALSLLLCLIQDGDCLKNVSLRIDPSVVQFGSHAALFCNYDLENAPLYSVKWYRGNLEFYRYSPGERPPTKIFPYSGIHVDLSVSNESVVVLRRVGFNLSGNFSCEVTVEAPTFSTATVYQQMLVVALPDGPPVITTEREHYELGDILRANCSSPPSKPPVSLSFHLNNIPVGLPEVRQYRTTPDALHESWLTLTSQVFPFHYNSRGHLILRCTAHIGSFYRSTTELHLTPRAREPVPERVTSQNSGAQRCQVLHLVLVLLLACHVAS